MEGLKVQRALGWGRFGSCSSTCFCWSAVTPLLPQEPVDPASAVSNNYPIGFNSKAALMQSSVQDPPACSMERVCCGKVRSWVGLIAIARLCATPEAITLRSSYVSTFPCHACITPASTCLACIRPTDPPRIPTSEPCPPPIQKLQPV